MLRQQAQGPCHIWKKGLHRGYTGSTYGRVLWGLYRGYLGVASGFYTGTCRGYAKEVRRLAEIAARKLTETYRASVAGFFFQVAR